MSNSERSKNKASDTYYVISYRDPKENKIRELKAKKVSDSTLGLGFVSVADFVFTSKNSLVVDPAEEYLIQRLENVKSMHLSIYNIVSIEEVGLKNQGIKFAQDKSNLIFLKTDTPPVEPNQ